MDINLSAGSLYVGGDFLGDAATTYLETAYESIGSKKLTFNCDMSFTSDFTVNWDVLEQLTMPQWDKTFVIQAERPIMIQARWHKKARVNKKWLKRYGMKSDTVKMEMIASQLEYTPENGVGIAADYIVGTENNFSFNTDEIKYIFRNDQLIKKRRIELA